MYREVIINLITGTPIRGTFEVLEPCDGKLSRTVLRGEGSRKAPDLPGASEALHHYINPLQLSTGKVYIIIEYDYIY